MNICQYCDKECQESWIILSNENIILDTEEKKAPKYLHYCSYLCNKRDKRLPNSTWKYVQNKKDFLKDPIPVMPKKKVKFEYLTFEEINQMNDQEKFNYYKLKNDQIDLYRNNIYEELEKEDEHTYMLENNQQYSSSDDY